MLQQLQLTQVHILMSQNISLDFSHLVAHFPDLLSDALDFLFVLRSTCYKKDVSSSMHVFSIIIDKTLSRIATSIVQIVRARASGRANLISVGADLDDNLSPMPA